MKIKLAHGIDTILFGSSKEQILTVLGKSEREYKDGSGNTYFCYTSLGLALKFEIENQDLLGWIQVVNPEVELLKLKPIGQQALGIIEELKEELGKNIEEQDFGDWQSLTFEDYWLELHVSIGIIKQINFGVLYDEGDKPKWPREAGTRALK